MSPARPLASPLRRSAWLLLLPPLAALTASLTLSYLWNEDFWWYLSSGQAILEHGGIPDEDPFLFTSGSGGWVYHSWLWTVLVAAIEGLGGLGGVVVFHSVLALALVAAIYTTARVDRFGLVNALAVLLVLLTVRTRLCGKAEVATWLLLVVFYRLLELRDEFTWRRGAALGALQVLWANLHGGYPLGIFIALCSSAGGWLQERFGRGRRGSGEGAAGGSARPPLWFPLLLFALAVADPRMFRERLAPFGLVTGSETVQPRGESGTMLILEWRSPFASAAADPTLPWLWVAAVGAGLVGFLAVRRRSWPRWLFFLGMVVLGATAVRHLGGLAVAAALVTLSNLGERWSAARAREERRPKGRRGRARPGPAGGRWLYPAACGLVAAFALASAAALRLGRSGFEGGQSTGDFFTVHPAISTPGAADYCLRYRLPGPFFNDYRSGAYLGYRLHPERRVFVDSRVIDPALVVDYTEIVGSERRWRAAEARYGFRTAVLGKFSRTVRSPMGVAIQRDPRWRLTFFSPLAVIYTREPANAAPESVRLRVTGSDLAARAPFTDPPVMVPPLPALRRLFLRDFPANYLVEYLAVLGQLGRAGDAEALATEALEVMPGHPRVLRQRCASRLVGGDLAGAREDCTRAHERIPADAQVAALYATVLLEAGERSQALQVLSEAERENPGDPYLRQVRDRVGGRR